MLQQKADRLHILYVDDEPDIREIAAAALSLDTGLQVDTASSGNDALDRLRQGDIDLVLLDVMMPEMDGLTTLSKMKSDSSTRDIA